MLFTDIEGSTRLLQELGRDAYVRALNDHRRVLREAFSAHGGVEVETQGDSFFAAFARARDAVAAAADAQRILSGHTWESEPVRVRIGIHTGEPVVNEGLYAGLDVHRAARVMSAGHGGQVLLSQTTRDLVDDEFTFRDFGAHRLKDLARPIRLYQLGDDDFPPLKTLDATNLPVAAGPLLGREHELEELVELLSDGARLLTITGPGGTGKTRLALQTAAELTGTFADGVFWVPLVSVADPDLVVPTIAHTIGAGPRIAEYVREKELLLLLDNAEHVVKAAPAIAELVAAAPRLRLLVTSRAPLHVSAEHEYPLDPLPDTDAVTLFVERARSVGCRLEPSETIDAICRRLDRLPLAIELAAARTKLLAPETLLERLTHALPLLTAGARDAPDRQRTLQATIEWSYELLDEEAKRLFARLSIFTATFSLEAAEEVCDAQVDTLASLVDLSLVKPIGSSRFLMLETIREYALACLADAAEDGHLRAQHGDYFLRLAAEAVPGLGQTNAKAAIDRIAEELPNIRSALTAVAESQPDRSLRVAVDLGRFWNARAPEEALHVLERLYHPDVEPGLRIAALGALSFSAMDSDDFAKAERYKNEELALARALDDRTALGKALPVASLLARWQGDIEAADRLTAEGVELARRESRDVSVGRLLWYRGAAEIQFGDVDVGLAWYERSLEAHASDGNDHGMAWARFGIGDVRCRLGHWEDARQPLELALERFHAGGEWKALANCLDHLAAAAAQTDAPTVAARLRGAADALWTSMNVPLELAYRAHLEEAIGSARAALGDEAYERERRAGEAMSVDDAVSYALNPSEA